MSVNSVNLANGDTLIDLTGDTVTSETLAEGETAHDARGEVIVGAMPKTTVLYTAQTLTEEQKLQARENIGAMAKADNAPPIVCTVSGDTIVVSDSSERLLQGLRIFGKTTQDGTPTPDAPVELVSVGAVGYIEINIGISEMDENPQTLTVSTPNGLPGIPVPSGGNYTDESGQQWVCDEVDFARGVYVQRTASAILTGEDVLAIHEDKSTDITICVGFGKVFDDEKGLENRYCLTDVFPTYYGKNTQNASPDIESVGFHNEANYCSYLYARIYRHRLTTQDQAGAQEFLNNNPITILYQLVAPIETDLSEEELAAYAALHTNYPSTIVFNDAGADMELKYVADTKLYIDNKFAELASALVSST